MPYANPADKAARRIAQRATRRQAGLCDRCGKEPAAMGYVHCAPCVVKHRTECWRSGLRKYARDTGNSGLTPHENKCWEFYRVVNAEDLSIEQAAVRFGCTHRTVYRRLGGGS